MSDSERVVLVMGATGQQGGATARKLLDNGWKVRALVRDPSKPQAVALAAAGAQIVQGDYDDRASLEAALAGVYGAFSVQTPFAAWGTEGETRQGNAIADAALAAGVRHLVYSSVGGANRNTGIPHFESKWQVEQHIAGLGIPATILRPVFFMENFATILPPQEQDGTLVFAMPMQPERPLQLIATADIGSFAAMAFAQPERWIGQSLDLAGDELTLPQIAAAWGEVVGRPAQFAPVPVEALRESSDDMYRMFNWFDTVGYSADIAALREQHPELKSFATWLRETLA